MPRRPRGTSLRLRWLLLAGCRAMLQKDGHDIFIPQSLEELKELRGTLLYAVQAHPVSR
jgi:hypothetical protein